MITVNIAPEFLLAAANSEMAKAKKVTDDLNRLKDVGYLYSQTGLDLAIDVKRRLTKAYDLLGLVDFPGVSETRRGIMETIAKQDLVISMIKLSL